MHDGVIEMEDGLGQSGLVSAIIVLYHACGVIDMEDGLEWSSLCNHCVITWMDTQTINFVLMS